MHKKFFTFAVPLLGAAVLVGAGFSAWVFQGSGSANITGTISVTPAIDTLNVKLYKDASTKADEVTSVALTLDQGGVMNNDVTKGATTDVSSYDILVTFTETNGALDALFDDYQLTLNAAISVAAATKGEESILTTFTNYVDLTDDSKTATGNFTANDENAFVIENVPLLWTYAQKPTTLEAYNTMNTALSDANFTITVTVTASWTARS